MTTNQISQFALVTTVALGSMLHAACGGQSTPGAPTPLGAGAVTMTLAPGQMAAVPNTSLSLRFTAVSNDSRCPADAFCIQLGEAVVALEASSGSGVTRFELRTSEAGRAGPVDNYRIELLTLLPYPYSSRSIDSAEYRATLRIEPR